MNNSSPDIFGQFRAAGRLINEWRDTLFYTGVATLAGMDIANGGDGIEEFLRIGDLRELTRFASWMISSRRPDPRLVGDRTAPIDYNKFVFASFALAKSFQLLKFTHNSIKAGSFHPGLSEGFALLLGAYAFREAGGIQGIRDAYKIMWDYPRKKDGGGTSQTQKFKEGFQKMGQRLIEVMVPTPAPNPTRGMSKSAVLTQITAAPIW